MSSPHSASRPAEAGTGHRVKLIPLAVHNAMAPTWGRPWRKRSLSLPAPRGMTFRKVDLPVESLRSWLHLLSQAGMLERRPAPLQLSLPPEDDDAPRDIVDLGLELSTDMILDFAQFARLTAPRSEEEAAAAEPEVPEALPVQDSERAGVVARANEDEVPAFGHADRLSLDSVDDDFLGLRASMQTDDAQPTAEATAPTGADEWSAMRTDQDSRPTHGDSVPAQPHAAETPTLARKNEPEDAWLAELPAEEEVSFDLREVELLEVPAGAEAALESVQPEPTESLEPAGHEALPVAEVVESCIEETAGLSEPEQVVATVLEEPDVQVPAEQSAPEVVAPVEAEQVESPEVAALEVSPLIEVVESLTPEAVEPSELQRAEVAAVVTPEEPDLQVPAERSPPEVVAPVEAEQVESPEVAALEASPLIEVVDSLSPEAVEPSELERAEVSAVVTPEEPDLLAPVEQNAPEVVALVEAEQVEFPEVAALGSPPVLEAVDPFIAETVELAEQEQAEVLGIVAQPESEILEVVEIRATAAVEHFVPASIEGAELQVSDVPETDMQWEPVEPIQQPELVNLAPLEVELAPSGISSADCETDEFFEPMISGLADTLAVLAATGHDLSHGEALVTTLDEAKVSSAANAVAAPRAGDSNPEAAALQGILIQKESEMTEMQDTVVPQADMKGSAIPITSMELQEVAAALSVPQLEADPDDVLSDVQNTLNSLAGMAQGLTHQKQAAGRLQEELEEWNIQLQERERLAGDKEERLLQLENHLKQAKTNLDRMAAENNRLLAERSEALKELAQTVDLRDKTTVKRAESVQLEQQRIDEQLGALRSRAFELDERESALKRKTEELAVRLKNLQSAKDKFSTIVKSFNETVQFNSTLSAISKSVTE
ncbi:hypothetical protein [Pseudomonas nitroreducens]|uniref:hypothetical protein n=1 Tax=Pseudomonas nitroreducens TaxID=46680 RepID=UPI0026593744|nr:hypothetical protein [Pseudomonas nitroreducens]MCP1650178.1 regulator of replication initiation timing [Pseudomonas nitroreducens]MCP1687952.1 regulator of replication initiation timing [Pseudomonas nitroreducens]